MGDPFEKYNTVDPTAGQSQENTEASQGVEQTQGITENTSVEQQTGQQSTEQVDTFFETFNKRFSTQYKTDDELKSILFDLPKKVAEYEPKVKERDELAKSVDQYKRDLETQRSTEAQRYLSDPRMQRAWVAKQLVEKHPECDPEILSSIAMSDISKMDALEAIAKERKVNLPELSLEDIKTVILSDLGVDPTSDPKEWDNLAKAKLAMKGAEAKANLKKLTEGIELPKFKTQEELKKEAAENLAKMQEKAAPFKAEFSKFDKLKLRDDLEYTVDDEYKSTLPAMFDRFITESGIEPTPENIANLNKLREAFYIADHKDKLFDAMYKHAVTQIKKQEDIENGNIQPPNTSTASDQLGGRKPSDLPGHDDFKREIYGQRTRTLK